MFYEIKNYLSLFLHPIKVKESRESLLLKIRADIKNFTYKKLEKWKSKTTSITDCKLFDFENFCFLLGKAENIKVGGSFMNEYDKPIIWVNTCGKSLKYNYEKFNSILHFNDYG